MKKTEMREKERGIVPSRLYGHKDKTYAEYLEKLNPRADETVQQALAECPDIRFQEFLDRCMSPKYLKVSYATIAKGCGISLTEFSEWWRKASVHLAIATAQIGSVQVVTDMVEDAKSKELPCERCEALGFVTAPPGLPEETPGYRMIQDGLPPIYIRTCPLCKGTGSVRKPGDSHARDKVLEASGVIQKGKPAVHITQNFGGATHSTAITNLDAAMDITEGEVVEGEVVDDDEIVN